MQLFDRTLPFFKGNTHTHTKISDGRCTPEESIAFYKQHGYDFLVLTDHYKQSPERVEQGLLVLSGTEVDYTFPTQVVHMTAFGAARDIDLAAARKSPQDGIACIRAEGARVILAHPAWSLNTTELMCSFRGLSGVEIFNSVSSVPTNALRGDSAAMLDPVFANGQLLNCFANDDSHRYEGECGMSATMLNTDDRSVAGILRAIDEGRFYATQGTEIRELSLTDGVVHIACSPAKYIIFYSNEVWIPNRTRALEGQTSADYVVSPRETFVRVQVVAEDGKSAWTSPIKLG